MIYWNSRELEYEHEGDIKMKLELTQHEVLTILQALAFAGHYAKKDRGDEFFDLYDRIDEQLKKDGEE